MRVVVGAATAKMGRHGAGAQGGLAWPKVSQKTVRLEEIDKKAMLWTVPGVLTPQEARAFIDVAEAAGFSHQGSRGPAYGEAFRDNGRLQVTDAALASRLWAATGLAALFAGLRLAGGAAGDEAAVGLNPNIRVYKYEPGQRFGRHIDEAAHVGFGAWTRFTLLIYLSTCGGGETVFYGARGRRLAAVAPSAGAALLHLHGDECLEHEGAAVTAGVKYVLRSDVVFEPV